MDGDFSMADLAEQAYALGVKAGIEGVTINPFEETDFDELKQAWRDGRQDGASQVAVL